MKINNKITVDREIKTELIEIRMIRRLGSHKFLVAVRSEFRLTMGHLTKMMIKAIKLPMERDTHHNFNGTKQNVFEKVHPRKSMDRI